MTLCALNFNYRLPLREPTLSQIAADTRRQADKEETTTVQIGNRTISDVVVKQQEADGYKFVK